ncbi:MAG: type II and III secretion system protein, partial [Spirochaetales bacterium]|nr:type II and III secretion system protein [Spirochaetales bacterium]
INRNEILKNYNINIYLPLKHISVNELPNIIPQELLSGSKYKMDIKNNSILLSGSELEIMSLKEFIESIDESMEGNIYYRFDLKYLTVQDFTGILPDRYKHSNPRIIPGINSFVMLCTQDTRNSIEEYIELVDKKNEGIPVHLKYITAEDLLKNIPPSVEKTEIIETGNPSVIFFTGSEDKREQFLREMEVIDRPVPQIRYELLVVQYQESKSLKWGLGLEASLSNANSQNYFLGNIGQLLSLNFDIVSSFGYVFAANLSLELGDSSAKIFADTTLNGLSGEEINFQNTNTYRYRDMEIDPDTGEAKSTGVTREITSGLMINLNGRTLGDNIVTMNISATVSKTGVDTSATAGTPPPTSEKIIKTHVRTESGKPVIISGLIQQDVAVSIKRVPILGSIPLLGWLFRSEVYSKENTEMEIYIIPHVVYPEGEEIHIGRRLEQIYQKYVKRY